MLYAPNYYGDGEPTDSPGVTTLLSRITDTIQTKAQADTDTLTITDAIDAIPDAPTASSIASAVWGAGSRTLTAISDSSGVATLLSRITGLLQTKSQADADQQEVLDAIAGIEVADADAIIQYLQTRSVRFLSSFDSTTQQLSLVQNDTYAVGSAREAVKLPLPDKTQIVAGDDCYLQIAIGTIRKTYPGEVVVAGDAKFAQFEMTPLFCGDGVFEVDHIDASGNKSTFFRDVNSEGSPLRIAKSIGAVPV